MSERNNLAYKVQNFMSRFLDIDEEGEITGQGKTSFAIADYVISTRATTPTASELVGVLRAYEAWEGDLILNGDWSGETVTMTQAQHDRMLEIQALRNAALSHIGEE